MRYMNLAQAASLPGPPPPGYRPPTWWELERLDQYAGLMDPTLFDDNERVVDEIVQRVCGK